MIVKSTAMLAILILSTNLYADALSTVRIYPVSKHVPHSRDINFSSYHTINVMNNTGSDQTVNVCYTLTVCPNLPRVSKASNECYNYTVGSGLSKVEAKNETVIANFNFTHQECAIEATTNVIGAMQSHTRDYTIFTVD